VSANEWYEKNRDDFVVGVSGTGLTTRAEYDFPAMLDAYGSYVRAQDQKILEHNLKLRGINLTPLV
jgi:hypothetical protein